MDSDNVYVVITPAYNEGKYISKTIESVLAQTILPAKWVIISDGSTDNTDDIVKLYADKNQLIQFVRLEKSENKGNFASKVFAFNRGYQILKEISYSYICNMDADVSFDAHYFEDIMQEFRRNPRLGIAGGRIFEETGSGIRTLSFEDLRYVSGRIQLFRRECYDDIGGYRSVAQGGEDTIAAVMARMHGWQCTIYPHLKILHHKTGASARGFLKESFRDGAKDYHLGSHPVFQCFKSLNRIRQRPYFFGAVVRLSGFLWQYLSRQERPVNAEFVKFFRSEQREKMKLLLQRFR